MQDIDQIANNLQRLRKINNLSQNEVAEILNTTQQQYWKYENKKQELPIRHLITLAKYYKVSTDNILGIEIDEEKMQSIEEMEVIKLFRVLTEREKGRIIERMIMLINSEDKIYGGLIIKKGENKND